MKILHIIPSTNGYEEVTLVANAVSKNNDLAVIEREGKLSMTGGFLINDTPEIRAVLDGVAGDKQYEFVRSFKMNPFVKFYHETEQ